ncbi:hypothetical protein ACMGD3_05495 [Lysinibacillus sphaericus]|uniref:hypothetical protein n=1 Tax=Lysinibacillus sphaericus TaxID=1421 RepID=UPI003F7AE5FF
MVLTSFRIERNTGEATGRRFACVTNIVLVKASTNGILRKANKDVASFADFMLIQN